jgi:hypothetical protein
MGGVGKDDEDSTVGKKFLDLTKQRWMDVMHAQRKIYDMKWLRPVLVTTHNTWRTTLW